MESSTAEMWLDRVERWRASNERAELFSRREGYAASTLRWWASKLKRDMVAAPTVTPEVRLARVIRTSPAEEVSAASGCEITLDVLRAGVRISIEAGADRATLAMVLDVLGVGGSR